VGFTPTFDRETHPVVRVCPEHTAAVILVGGLGTRIRHLHPDLPKPMIPVRGRPFAEWLVRFLAAEGINRILLATGHRAEVVARHFHDRMFGSCKVHCVAEPRALGTAGAFLHAVAAAGPEPRCWLVLNGDSMVATSLGPLFDRLEDPDTDGALLAVTTPDAARYGSIETSPDDDLIAFGQKRAGSGLINAGIYLFRAPLLAMFPSGTPLSFETDVFPGLTRRGARLKVWRCGAPFLDIGTPESLARAEGFLDQHASSWLKA
jgi:D-glycero-alpha-D-manno-heptose 1-phosphate guanylyltransferase